MALIVKAVAKAESAGSVCDSKINSSAAHSVAWRPGDPHSVGTGCQNQCYCGDTGKTYFPSEGKGDYVRKWLRKPERGQRQAGLQNCNSAGHGLGMC